MILNIWSDVYVGVHGSTFTGQYLPNSDIDFIMYGVLDPNSLQALQKKLLSSDIAEPNTVNFVNRTYFPILTFIDRESQIPIDITFNNKTITLSSSLMKKYNAKYPVLPKLFLVLKQFLKQRNLESVRAGKDMIFRLIFS